MLCRPAVDEKAGRDEDRAGDHEWNAEFGTSLPSIFLLELSVNAIVDRGADLRPQEAPDAEGDVVEAADADAFLVAGFPEEGKGREDEVHEAVEVGHVDGEDLDDDLGAEEDEGAGDGAFHGVGEGAFGVFVFGVEDRVGGFFAEFFGFDVEEFRGALGR